MRVIIVGGSGLIGRALTANLTGDGHEVIILSRNPARAAGLPAGARAEGWDGRTAAGWGAAADGADAIVNLAGENLAGGRWTEERKRALRDSRLLSGQAVVQAVQSASRKPAVVVQASAVGYYGPHGDEEVTEETPPGSDFLARLAVEWEASTAPVESWGVRRVLIRTTPVLSLKEGALPRMVLPFRYFVGGPLGSGRQWFPWIHVADEAAAIRFLMERPDASGPYNLTAPQSLTNAQFSKILGRVMGRPSLIPTPALALRLIFGEMSTVLLDGQRAVPRRLQSLGFAFRFPDAETALRDLFHR